MNRQGPNLTGCFVRLVHKMETKMNPQGMPKQVKS